MAQKYIRGMEPEDICFVYH
ncbi:MAG: hypothetical protein ACK4MW_05445 [Aquificaceae bacterium]